MRVPEKEAVSKESQRLREKFGAFATLVVDEILDKAHSGYDYDAKYEVPLYEEVKKSLEGI